MRETPRKRRESQNHAEKVISFLVKTEKRAAAPFAVCGFFTYHGMTPEQLLWAWCKSELLCPKRLVFRSDSYYYTAMQPAMQAGLRKKKQCKKRKRGKPVDKQHHKNQERRA